MFQLIAAGVIAAITGSVYAQNRVLAGIDTPPAYTITEGPLVSVIIPAYNEEHYLPSLLAALRNQTYQRLEVIVVDDASIDLTPFIAGDYNTILLQKTDNVANVARSRNIGADSASGDILVFNDADSIPEQKLIEASVTEIMSGKKYVYSNHCCTDSVLHGATRVALGTLSIPPLSANGQFAVVDRSAFAAVGGFDESIGFDGEDRKLAVDIINTFGISAVGYLRWMFSATSARRQLQQGIIPSIRHDIVRAIR